MTYSTKRRFMAGAVCPRCATLDVIVVYNLDGRDYRECVSCDFKEEMRIHISAGELPTRVTQTQALDSHWQTIRLPGGDSSQ
jgi:uncharacterized metal-binding protein (TIGR02443 family)